MLWVRSEDLPQPLVPSLVEQVTVEFAERRQEPVSVGDDDGVVVIPPSLLQEVVDDAYEQELQDAWAYEQVKAGRPADVAGLAAVADRLVAAGAGCVLLACTELSVLHDALLPMTRHVVVDSVDSLARATVLRAGARLA